jgi:hypothetical protein
MLQARDAFARAVLGIAITLVCFAAQAAPQLGVYRWDAPDGPANVDDFGRWLGRAPVIASFFHGRGTWGEIDGQEWQLSSWSKWVKAQSGRNVTIAIPLLPKTGGSLASCAAGQYDGYWRNLANNLAYYGLTSAYLRLGWEMDGSWFAWGAPQGSGKEASFAGCFRRVVQVMRQTQPYRSWKFVWNPGFDGWKTSAWFSATWPGDSYVDVIGVDIYDQSWATNTYPYPSTCDASCRLTRQQNAWNNYYWRLNTLRDFAIARGKPMAFPEWGVIIRSDGHGGGDNTYFLRKMYDFMMDARSKVVFHAYFNVSQTDTTDHRLTSAVSYDSPSGATRLPNSASLFKQLFGPQAPSGLAFKAPLPGATVSGSLWGSACEVTGSGISKVVFFMDSTQLNTESAAPWTCGFDTRYFANGTHTLRAVAYSSTGASTSASVSVNVQNGGPTVNFKAPSSGATVSGVLWGAACEVAGSGISKVQFSMDGVQLNLEGAAPWNCSFDTRRFANGSHTLKAIAYDSAGRSATVTRSVYVKN